MVHLYPRICTRKIKNLAALLNIFSGVAHHG
ncbi:hypothetical protein P3T40_003548 [Paraburkholderia sp. EB58]